MCNPVRFLQVTFASVLICALDETTENWEWFKYTTQLRKNMGIHFPLLCNYQVLWAPRPPKKIHESLTLEYRSFNFNPYQYVVLLTPRN